MSSSTEKENFLSSVLLLVSMFVVIAPLTAITFQYGFNSFIAPLTGTSISLWLAFGLSCFISFAARGGATSSDKETSGWEKFLNQVIYCLVTLGLFAIVNYFKN